MGDAHGVFGLQGYTAFFTPCAALCPQSEAALSFHPRSHSRPGTAAQSSAPLLEDGELEAKGKAVVK